MYPLATIKTVLHVCTKLYWWKTYIFHWTGIINLANIESPWYTVKKKKKDLCTNMNVKYTVSVRSQTKIWNHRESKPLLLKLSFVFASVRHSEMQRLLLFSAVLLVFMLNYAFCNEVWNLNCKPWSKLRKEKRLVINMKCNNFKATISGNERHLIVDMQHNLLPKP